MPRHRIEASRQRTLWPAAVQSARRVQFRAAGRRGTPSHAKPAVAPEWRQRLTRSQRRMLQRAGRRLLVSPWFAAGAGFVIAAGAIIYMPHARLDPAINVTPCKHASCKKPPSTPLVGARPLQVGVGAPIPAPSPPTTTVWYQQVDHSTQSGFGIWIAVPVPRSTGHWQLRFVIPGASHLYVYGALSKPYETDGLTVSNLLAGTESAGYAEISGLADGGFGGSSQNGDTVLFQVRGTGNFATPTQCSFNDASCQFKSANDLAPAQWPGSE